MKKGIVAKGKPPGPPGMPPFMFTGMGKLMVLAPPAMGCCPIHMGTVTHMGGVGPAPGLPTAGCIGTGVGCCCRGF